MKTFILGILTVLLISCNQEPKTKFSLRGTTESFENGTSIYLDLENTLLDSTIVENNSFVFKTNLPETPLLVVLRTKDFSHYRFLWLENSLMTFDATQTDFRHAIVTGSNEENLSQNLSKETDSLPRNESLKKEMEFVNNNPNSIHSAYILSVYSSTWGREKTKNLFEQLSERNKNSKYGLKISKYIELNKNPKIGEKYVDFEMTDSNGQLRKLSEIKGKIILLEFWASWCGPCRQENPNLVKTYDIYNPKGFEIFAVSLDVDKNSWINAIEADKLNWSHVSDLNGDENKASLIYGINGIPDNFLIDENGVIIGRSLRGEKLNEKLAELLN